MVRKVLILGAAGRDFHNFNVAYRDDATAEVVAFTAAQIPGIAGRRYPASLAGARYPEGIPIFPEARLEELVREQGVDEVVFAYSDVTHLAVMHLASRALANSRQVSPPAGTPGPCFWRKRISVVTSVPALALKAVLGRRMAPIRFLQRAIGRRPSEKLVI